ncbi:MAG: LLM class flavin-dependent oxidoreductase [Acidimicrobiia bacterium]
MNDGVTGGRPPLAVGVGPLALQTVGGTPAETGEQVAVMVESARVAEAAGLDSVVVSEHHFAEDGYLPSPLLALAALARETSTLRLATGVALGGLYDPLRLAEDAALLDHLSGGRFELGLGLGYRDLELRAFGTTRKARVERIERCVEVLRAAWAGTAVTGTGLLAPDEGVAPRPLPATAGGPPLLLGAFVAEGVRRAGRLGDGWIAPVLSSPAQLGRRLDLLRDVRAFARPFRVVVSLSGFVAATDAWATCRQGVARVEAQYRRWLQESGDLPGLDGRPFDEGRDDGRPPGFVVGTPAECVAALRPWLVPLAGLPVTVSPELVLRVHYPGLDPEVQVEAVRLLGEEVAPVLRGAWKDLSSASRQGGGQLD